LLEHLDGQCSLDEARVRGIRATKALGRRQLTWLRAEEGISRLVAEDLECAARMENEIRSHWHIRARRATPGEGCK
jgi:tRNA dimethylallyltransferase